jgi:hypothetical protein
MIKKMAMQYGLNIYFKTVNLLEILKTKKSGIATEPSIMRSIPLGYRLFMPPIKIYR